MSRSSGTAISPRERIQLYANLMEEVRIRTDFINDLIEKRKDWRPQFLGEVCWLQLRMICEVIALACLLAHGDVNGKNQLERQKPKEIFAILADINPDFFPKPISLEADRGSVVQRIGENFLTPQGLVDLWNKTGDRLHRGKSRHLIATHKTGPTVNLEEIGDALKKIVELLQFHVIVAAGFRRAILVEMCVAETGRVGCVPRNLAPSKENGAV